MWKAGAWIELFPRTRSAGRGGFPQHAECVFLVFDVTMFCALASAPRLELGFLHGFGIHGPRPHNGTSPARGNLAVPAPCRAVVDRGAGSCSLTASRYLYYLVMACDENRG